MFIFSKAVLLQFGKCSVQSERVSDSTAGRHVYYHVHSVSRLKIGVPPVLTKPFIPLRSTTWYQVSMKGKALKDLSAAHRKPSYRPNMHQLPSAILHGSGMCGASHKLVEPTSLTFIRRCNRFSCRSILLVFYLLCKSVSPTSAYVP